MEVVQELIERYISVRRRTVELAAPLSIEDQLVQPMDDASPTKWHLAHTTWFFETVVLGEPDPEFNFLFNSYYEQLGPRVARSQRGMLSRPSLERVHAYRQDVDERIVLGARELDASLLELGLHHEQQHQELLLTDAKYVLGTQPLRPAYRTNLSSAPPPVLDGWNNFGGGIVAIGAPDSNFAFDSERPRHRVYVEPFRLAKRAVTNREVMAFVEAGGYRDARLWLSDAWTTVSQEVWTQPFYWDGAQHFTMSGMQPLDPDATASHLSFYEADAIARFLGARLPTEAEWEVVASSEGLDLVNDADADALAPRAGAMFGDVWEWTRSAYLPYPGFRELSGAVGEYNGKFMSGQQVLRGGSCFTPRGHIRASYRNFFPPSARWQMTGVRLAADA